jgi:uncharacterized protein (TIGR02217 family)
MNFLEFPCFPAHFTQQITRSLSFLTEVVQLASSHEQRNALWSQPLRRYELSAHAQTPAELATLELFFQAVRGRWLPFRFKDPLDYSSAEKGKVITSTDQLVGRGDGLQRAFQLIKTTRVGELEQTRIIQKPTLHSVVVAVEGRDTKDVEVDFTTGVITFLKAPPLGAVITAGFAFDVPCRFDSDQCVTTWQPPHLGSFALSVLELRLPQAPLVGLSLSEVENLA